MVTIRKRLCNGWVNINQQISFTGNLVVSFDHLGFDEICKSVAKVGINEVHQKLLWDVSHFTNLR